MNWDERFCPKCGGPLANMTGVGFNAPQFRKEDGRCFTFDEKTFECVQDHPGDDFCVVMPFSKQKRSWVEKRQTMPCTVIPIMRTESEQE